MKFYIWEKIRGSVPPGHHPHPHPGHATSADGGGGGDGGRHEEQNDLAEMENGGLPKNISTVSSQAMMLSDEDAETFEDEHRQVWDSPVEFLLSCLSFAVGLGNIWRFPYLCYRNGGGAFLIPYALNIIFTGIPLFFFELSFGQFASKSPIAIWCVSPLFQGLGLSMLVISVIVASYYNVIIAWAVYYFGAAFASLGDEPLPWTTCNNWWNSEGCQELHNIVKNKSTLTHHNTTYESAAEEYFSRNVLQISESIEEPGSLRWQLVICLAITWLVIFFALLKGVKSFGKAVYFTAIFPYVILTILLIKGLSLPGAFDGVIFYIKPDWSRLLDHQVWADAAIQIFFSLGPCWGALITLSSYNKFSTNCFKDAVTIAIANCATSFFAGFVVFSFVGFMAYELDKDVSEVADTGPGLAFVVYPEAVSLLPAGQIWSLLFFLMLLALGFGTQFSIIEAIVRIIVDGWPKKWGKIQHRTVLIVMCSFMFLVGLTMVTNGGMYVLQLLDNHAGTFSALMNGVVEVMVVSWIYGVDRFLGDIQVMFQWSTNTKFYRFFHRYWSFMWRFGTPTLLVVILSLTFANHEPMKYGSYVYPNWANCVGWMVTAASVIFIPLVALIKIIVTPGTFVERMSVLLNCSQDWGPKLETDRMAAQDAWAKNDYPFPLAEMQEFSSISSGSQEQEDLLTKPEA